MRRLFVIALALTIVLPLVAVLLAAAAVSSQAQCAAGAAGPGSAPGVPSSLLPIFEQAAGSYQLGPGGWAYLAAINEVESNFDHVQRVLDVLELEREARRGAQAGGSNSRRVGHMSDSPMNSLRVASTASRVHPRRIPERRFCRGSPNSAAQRSRPPVRFTFFRRWVNPSCSNSALDGHTLRPARYSAWRRRSSQRRVG